MFTLLQVSLLADVTFSCFLIFLWLVHRGDRYALYWGGGQLSFAAMTLCLSLSEVFSPAVRYAAASVLFVLSLMGYWLGTRVFCGLPAVRRVKRVLFPLLGAALYALSIYQPRLASASFAAFIGAMFWWCGAQFMRGRHTYRLVGLLLMLRGVLNFGFALSLATQRPLELLFATSFLVKSASVLGLIYAVLNEGQTRLHAAIGSLGNGFMIGDAQGIIRLANDKFAHLLGFGRGVELTGRALWQVFPGLTQEAAAQRFRRIVAVDAQLPLVQEELIVRHDGTMLPIESISSVYVERGQPMALVQVFDISERVRQREILLRAANFDALSGLHNRHALDEFLRESLGRARVQGHACSVLFLDLDHFKRVNDSFGHSAGDSLLCMAAGRLRALVGPHDFLARFGGDEFVIVQVGLSLGAGVAQAFALAQRIIVDFSVPFVLEPNSSRPFSLHVTPSIGVALSPAHGDDPETLIKNADIAMYAAKAAGRNEVRLFDETMESSSRNAMLIEEALHHALSGNELRLVYQPVVEAGSGRLHKVEALVRWHSATLGFVPPDRFIPVAEDNGQIVGIGTWILQEACRQARAWSDGGIGQICISVNISAWQLMDSQFLATLSEAIAANGIRPQQIELELTERVLIEETGAVRQVLEAVQALGVSISLDDFGTGFSSLSYLTRFSLDTLKIDRSFVTHIEDNERDSALVRAIIAMGHSLGLQIVAEGVETAGQAALLTELGCNALQGYLFSRPLPPEQILPA